MKIMRIFVSNNIVLLLLGVIITIDASRVLYLPLLKIHPSHHESKSLPIVQESTKKSNEKKSINDEFIPLSAIERNMYDEREEEEEEREKLDTLDFDAFVNKDSAARHLIAVKELPPANFREWDSLDRNTRKSIKTTLSDDEGNQEIDRLSKQMENHAIVDSWPVDAANERTERLQFDPDLNYNERKKRRNDILFLVIVGTSSLVGVVGLIAAAIFWYKIQKRAEAALDSEYPSYGITGPGTNGSKISPSTTMTDRKLAQSAQMFHYQQQRQQMMAQEKTNLEAQPVHSEDEDDEEHAGGDYTVYECPGLATTGEMEVRNPLFAEPDLSSTSIGSTLHPATNNHYPQPSTAIPSTSPPKEKSLS